MGLYLERGLNWEMRVKVRSSPYLTIFFNRLLPNRDWHLGLYAYGSPITRKLEQELGTKHLALITEHAAKDAPFLHIFHRRLQTNGEVQKTINRITLAGYEIGDIFTARSFIPVTSSALDRRGLLRRGWLPPYKMWHQVRIFDFVGRLLTDGAHYRGIIDPTAGFTPEELKHLDTVKAWFSTPEMKNIIGRLDDHS